jgi:hypothetical protein
MTSRLGLAQVVEHRVEDPAGVSPSRVFDTTLDDPPLPRNGRSWVNEFETDAELQALQNSVKRALVW